MNNQFVLGSDET